MPPETFSDHTKSTTDDPYEGIPRQIVEDFLLEGGRCTPTPKQPSDGRLCLVVDPNYIEPFDSSKSDRNSIQEKALEEVLTRVLSNGTWQFRPSKDSEQYVSITPMCEFVHPESEFARNSRLQSPNAMEEAMLRKRPQGLRQEDGKLQYQVPPAQKPFDFMYWQEF